eukprot:1194288-Prorocentrum_minimum.AAC.4
MDRSHGPPFGRALLGVDANRALGSNSPVFRDPPGVATAGAVTAGAGAAEGSPGVVLLVASDALLVASDALLVASDALLVASDVGAGPPPATSPLDRAKSNLSCGEHFGGKFGLSSAGQRSKNGQHVERNQMARIIRRTIRLYNELYDELYDALYDMLYVAYTTYSYWPTFSCLLRNCQALAIGALFSAATKSRGEGRILRCEKVEGRVEFSDVKKSRGGSNSPM